MAGNKIRGITLEIDGDTSKLTKSISDVDKKLKTTQTSLNDVNKLLKLNPGNIELVKQKQELLTKSIEDSSEKLKALQSLQDAMDASGVDKSSAQYQALQREIVETSSKITKYKGDLEALDQEQQAYETNAKRLEKLFESTGTSVDDYADALGTKLTRALKDGTANSDDLKQAIEKVGKECTNGKADINDLTTALDTVDDGQAINNLIEDLKEAGDQANDTGNDLEDIANNTKVSAISDVADAVSGVTDKIKELGEAAVDASNELQNATTKVSAYFNETSEEAETSAEVIQSIYEDGVGDSMEAVADAVITVKKNLQDLDDTSLENITGQAITLDEMYGIDMNETLRGVNSLMVQFGLSAEDAMDLIVAGTQNGLDKTNELGDNVSEYAGKFAQAGYSAEEYFQLLNNGLDNGAYNLDKVNDAINEVTTRLADGTIGDSIDSYSDKTKELFEAWQNGQATQKDVIDSIVTDIGNCKNQQDQLNMAATAFGTMAEDGNMQFITSLTAVGDTYDDVSGKASDMYENTTTDQSEMEGNIRALKDALIPLGDAFTSLANDILPPFVEILTNVSNFFSELPEPVQTFIVVLGVLLVAFTALTPVIIALTTATTAFNVALSPILLIIGAVALAIAAIIVVIQQLITHWDEIKAKTQEVWDAICQKVTDVWNSIAETWQGVKDWFGEKWDAIKNKVTEIWDSITTKISDAWTSVTSTWQGVKDWFGDKWQGIKDKASSAWDSVKDKASTAWTNIKDKWSNSGNWFKDKWDSIKNSAGDMWEGTKEKFRNGIDKIKSFFNFQFSWPKLTLPHFSISPAGWKIGDLLKGSIPSLSISWYKKAENNPYYFDKPSVIGVGDVPEVVIGKKKFDELTSNTTNNSTSNQFNITVVQRQGENQNDFVERLEKKLSERTVRGDVVWR